MKKCFLIIFCSFSVLLSTAQKSHTASSRNQIENSIVEEGRKLYQLEMTLTLGSDIYKKQLNNLYQETAGYFPYKEGAFYKCVFYSRMADAQILATISFDSTFNINRVAINSTVRPMVSLEKSLYNMNQHAIDDIKKDTLFYKLYSNTTTSLLPLVEAGSRKIFVMTKSADSTAVIFGNDYVIDFDNANYISARQILHSELTTIEAASSDPYKEELPENVLHKHSGELGDLITSTDVCILLLNQKRNHWKHHVVMGQNNVSVWYCDTNELQTITKKVWYKYNKPETNEKDFAIEKKQ